MGRPKGSKNKKTLAKLRSPAKVTPVKSFRKPPTRGPKRNLLIEDSASEEGNSCASSISAVTNSSSESLHDFIDDTDVVNEGDGGSARELYVQETLDDIDTSEGRGASDSTIKPIGHDSYPSNEFSLTVTRSKGDVHPHAITCIHKFIQDCCIKGKALKLYALIVFKICCIGAVSNEVGKRAFNLHLQSVIKLHYPKTRPFVLRLAKGIKSYLPSNGAGYRVLIKPFKGAQTFSSMLGYCTKDNGKSHYAILLHNVDPMVTYIN